MFLKQDGTAVTLEQVDKKSTEEMVYNFKIQGDVADFDANSTGFTMQ